MSVCERRQISQPAPSELRTMLSQRSIDWWMEAAVFLMRHTMMYEVSIVGRDAGYIADLLPSCPLDKVSHLFERGKIPWKYLH